MNSNDSNNAGNTDTSGGYDAIEREHHTISTEQARTIFRRLDDLRERVESLERALAATDS